MNLANALRARLPTPARSSGIDDTHSPCAVSVGIRLLWHVVRPGGRGQVSPRLPRPGRELRYLGWADRM
jgi:hypothetical protein